MLYHHLQSLPSHPPASLWCTTNWITPLWLVISFQACYSLGLSAWTLKLEFKVELEFQNFLIYKYRIYSTFWHCWSSSSQVPGGRITHYSFTSDPETNSISVPWFSKGSLSRYLKRRNADLRKDESKAIINPQYWCWNVVLIRKKKVLKVSCSHLSMLFTSLGLGFCFCSFSILVLPLELCVVDTMRQAWR